MFQKFWISCYFLEPELIYVCFKHLKHINNASKLTKVVFRAIIGRIVEETFQFSSIGKTDKIRKIVFFKMYCTYVCNLELVSI